MKRKLTNLLKQSLRRLFAPFGTSGPERVLHAEKGRGRAFDIPFSRIPRGMCGQIEKSSFPAYAAGHPLSFGHERREPNAKGVPLGTPVDSVDFLSMKIDSDAGTRPGLYTERGCRPVFWGLLYLFSPAPAPTPGASGPLAGRAFLPGKHVIAGFPIKKTGRSPGRPFAHF